MTFNEVATAPRFGVDLRPQGGRAVQGGGHPLWNNPARSRGATAIAGPSFTIAPPPPPAPLRPCLHPPPPPTGSRSGRVRSGCPGRWGGGVLLLLLGPVVSFCCKKRRTLHKAMAAQKAQLEETPATPNWISICRSNNSAHIAKKPKMGGFFMVASGWGEPDISERRYRCLCTAREYRGTSPDWPASGPPEGGRSASPSPP